MWRSTGLGVKKRCTSLIGNLLVFGEEVGRLKEFGPLCFPLQNLVCDAEAWSPHTKHHTEKKPSTFRDKKGDLEIKDVNQAGVPLLHRQAAQRTVFKLFTHDGACWRGHVVCGVLLRVGGRDDGHQVVSVGRVHLHTSRHDTTHQALFKWPAPVNRFQVLNQPHWFSSRARKKGEEKTQQSFIFKIKNIPLWFFHRPVCSECRRRPRCTVVLTDDSWSGNFWFNHWNMREFLKRSRLDRTSGENIKTPWSTEMSFNAFDTVLTLGSHTGRFRLLSSGCFNNTGFGHSLHKKQKNDTNLQHNRHLAPHHLVEGKSFTIWKRPRRTCGPEWQPQRWGRVGRSGPPAWPTTLRPESPACWNRCRDLQRQHAGTLPQQQQQRVG